MCWTIAIVSCIFNLGLCDLKLMGCINITLENIKLKIDKLDIRGANVGTGTLKRLKNDIRYLEY
jgi:hypothetical protein